MADQRLRLRFARAARLRRGREFTQLRHQGRRRVSGCLIANWTGLPDGSTSRAGFIASRKLGTAVVRNRARRLMREAFRQHQRHLRQPVAVVLVARPSIVGKQFADVERDFLAAMQQARMLKDP